MKALWCGLVHFEKKSLLPIRLFFFLFHIFNRIIELPKRNIIHDGFTFSCHVCWYFVLNQKTIRSTKLVSQFFTTSFTIFNRIFAKPSPISQLGRIHVFSSRGCRICDTDTFLLFLLIHYPVNCIGVKFFRNDIWLEVRMKLKTYSNKF